MSGRPRGAIKTRAIAYAGWRLRAARQPGIRGREHSPHEAQAREPLNEGELPSLDADIEGKQRERNFALCNPISTEREPECRVIDSHASSPRCAAVPLVL